MFRRSLPFGHSGGDSRLTSRRQADGRLVQPEQACTHGTASRRLFCRIPAVLPPKRRGGGGGGGGGGSSSGGSGSGSSGSSSVINGTTARAFGPVGGLVVDARRWPLHTH